MPTNKPIKAGPTKAFFVRMLTRDIDLADAILDLLDNCVDGVVRELKRLEKPSKNGSPYKGYWAKIQATPDGFEIWDNCGGIPQDIAEKSAFMLGRTDFTRDSDIETVGMYGIGMKRAIFKMGRHSVVISQPDSGPYKVEIPPEWLDDEPSDSDQADNPKNPWQLELVRVGKRLPENGTKITVTQLNDGIGRQFDNDKSAFLADLEKEISRHYALILERGFVVTLNGTRIKPVSLKLLAPETFGATRGPAIEPYVLTGKVGDIQVDLVVGFYRPLATEAELEDEELVASSRENAGWTVICNNRVVLFNDKTSKTGWGTKGVTPGYHNQFISIAGVVSFRSTKSMNLPLNTTKRGIDTSSEIYHIVLNYMREGLKKFTSFTNRWKKSEEETQEAFSTLQSRRPAEIVKLAKAGTLTKGRTHKELSYYSPDLPVPEEKHKQRRICFAADQKDIELVAEHYFDDREHDRSEVGRRCFDESLKRAKRGLQ